jgi:hypothetical protein
VQKVEYEDYSMPEPFKMRFGPFQSFFVNHWQMPKLHVTFLEDEWGDIKAYFDAWKNLMMDSQGQWYQKLGGYAQTIMVSYFTADGLPLRTVTFINAFPLDLYKANLEYDRSDILKPDFRFACDGILETIAGVPTSVFITPNTVAGPEGAGLSNISIPAVPEPITVTSESPESLYSTAAAAAAAAAVAAPAPAPMPEYTADQERALTEVLTGTEEESGPEGKAVSFAGVTGSARFLTGPESDNLLNIGANFYPTTPIPNLELTELSNF